MFLNTSVQDMNYKYQQLWGLEVCGFAKWYGRGITHWVIKIIDLYLGYRSSLLHNLPLYCLVFSTGCFDN